MSDNPMHNLLSALAGAPSLPGARCRGKHHLFDDAGRDENPETVAQRHAQAIGLCKHCTALASCEQWFDELPARQRPHGVIAGRIHNGRTA